MLMKILFVILIGLVFSTITKSQTDTIIENNMNTIVCKITKITSMNIFYTQKGIGKTLSLKDITYHSKFAQIDATNKKPAQLPGSSDKKNENKVAQQKKNDTLRLKQRFDFSFGIGIINNRPNALFIQNNPSVQANATGFGNAAATKAGGVPPISFAFDYSATKSFSIGVVVGIGETQFTQVFQYPPVTYAVTHAYVYGIGGLRVLYSPQKLCNNKWDTYVGAMLNYVFAIHSSEIINGSSYFMDNPPPFGGLFFGAVIGARYHFTNNIGAYCEVGYGLTAINFGLNIKLEHSNIRLPSPPKAEKWF
jgi:hypothetical protein